MTGSWVFLCNLKLQPGKVWKGENVSLVSSQPFGTHMLLMIGVRLVPPRTSRQVNVPRGGAFFQDRRHENLVAQEEFCIEVTFSNVTSIITN